MLLSLTFLYSDTMMNSANTSSIMAKENPFLVEQYVQQYIDNTAPSVQVYYSIKKYCKVYNVPEEYAFKVAYIESGWKGPLQWKYNPYDKISSANAYGAMQVLQSTAQDVWKDKSITKEQLLNDVDFNVHTSIKYMRQLHDSHGSWGKVFSVYNTGYTTLNDYAMSVVN